MSNPPLPARVRILDAAVADQIAAGEVVERPASVLKELVENSLDAGSRELHIDIQGGGVVLIRVRDDGTGLHPEDMDSALKRHGTSKLQTFDDLEQLRTRGFRGEALPSIAAVSRLTMRSRIASEHMGVEVQVSGGKLRPPGPVAMPVGTIVEMRDLFFNTPARRRFLKTERTELGHLETVLRQTALAMMDIRLVANHGTRRLLSVRTGNQDPLGRVASVLGPAFANHLREVHGIGSEMQLRGWVSSPSAAVTTAPPRYLFLNGRPIKDNVIRHALGVAYQPLLAAGQQAGYVLYLDMPVPDVDINVHPAKNEVRFRDVRSVHDFVLVAVRRALNISASGIGIVNVTARPDMVKPIKSPDVPESSPATAGVALSGTTRSYGGRGTIKRYVGEPRGLDPRAILLERRLLLLPRADDLLLVDVAAAIAAAAADSFSSALVGTPLIARPLLVPARAIVAHDEDQALEASASALLRLGVEVSNVAPREWVLLKVPKALRHAERNLVLRAVLDVVRENDLDVNGLARVAGQALAAGESELRVDAVEAVVFLTRDGREPDARWGRALDAGALAQLLTSSEPP